jgi:xanthine/uracil permease
MRMLAFFFGPMALRPELSLPRALLVGVQHVRVMMASMVRGTC